MKKKLITLFLIFNVCISLFSQQKINDTKEISNYNQAIDILTVYLDMLNDGFLKGYSAIDNLIIAWEAQVDGTYWETTLKELQTTAIRSRNRFTTNNPCHLDGDEMKNIVDLQIKYLPEQVKAYNDLYDIFIYMDNMLFHPMGSLESYKKDMNNTKENFINLYQKTKQTIPEKEKINNIIENELQYINFLGITYETTYSNVIQCLNDNSLDFEEDTKWFHSIDETGKTITLYNVRFLDLNWWKIEIYLKDNIVIGINFTITDREVYEDYHNVINTCLFDNYSYEESKFNDFSSLRLTNYFDSKYKNTNDDYLLFSRYLGRQLRVKIIWDKCLL